jgi:Tfp pilus assembly protein PilN
MIKINLLGGFKPEPTARPAEPLSKAMQLATTLGALAVSFAVVGLIYLAWSRSIDRLNMEIRKQKAEQARLAAIKQENAKYDHDRVVLEERIKAIQVLEAGRVGPSQFMNALADAVNRTSTDLYLSSVGPQGDRVTLRGQAGSANTVAALISALKTSGYFLDVQLRQLYEDDLQSLVNYKFTMDCAYKSPSTANFPVPAGTAARASSSPAKPVL